MADIVPAPEWMHALRDAPFLKELGDAELLQVALLATEQTLPAGFVLGTQGEHGDSFYVLLSGLASAASLVGTKTERVISPPEVFGVTTLMAPHKYLGTAIVERECRVLTFRSVDLISLFSHDSIGKRMFHQIADELYLRLDEAIADAAGNPLGNYVSRIPW